MLAILDPGQVEVPNLRTKHKTSSTEHCVPFGSNMDTGTAQKGTQEWPLQPRDVTCNTPCRTIRILTVINAQQLLTLTRQCLSTSRLGDFRSRWTICLVCSCSMPCTRAAQTLSWATGTPAIAGRDIRLQ